MASRVLDILWQQSWQMSVLFVLVGLACLCLRRASAHWRYLLWLVVLIKCLAPPLISFNLSRVAKLAGPVFSQPARAQLVNTTAKGAVPVLERTTLSQSRSSASHTLLAAFWEEVNWPPWLAAAWAAAALSYLIVALVKAWRIQLGLAQRRTWPDMELECEFLELAKTVAHNHRPRLCLIRGLSQPFVWGIFRGSIYLPENFGRQGTSRQRMLVMGHELAHVLRWDALINFIQVLVQTVFVFHPLVWWLNRIIRHEREKCCDERAVASLRVAPEEYGSAIIDRLADYFEPACPSSSLAISGRAKDLEDRISCLLWPGRLFHSRPTVLAKVTVLLIALIVVPAQLAVKAKPAKPAIAMEMLARTTAMVDLSACANANFTESWLPNSTDNDLSGLEIGRYVFGGVPFQVSGIVQLSGAALEHAGGRFPVAVKGIKVARIVSKLHLVHACAGKEKDGVLIAKMILHYQDGEQREMPIAYGSQARDWQFWEFEPVNDTNTIMAWTGENLNVRAQNGSLRLYRTTWANPRPQSALLSLDYVSNQSRSAPFMVALTVE